MCCTVCVCAVLYCILYCTVRTVLCGVQRRVTFNWLSEGSGPYFLTLDSRLSALTQLSTALSLTSAYRSWRPLFLVAVPIVVAELCC